MHVNKNRQSYFASSWSGFPTTINKINWILIREVYEIIYTLMKKINILYNFVRHINIPLYSCIGTYTTYVNGKVGTVYNIGILIYIYIFEILEIQ